MGLFSTDLFSLFEEENAFLTLFLLAFFAPFPGLNFFVFSYFERLTKKIWEEADLSLPSIVFTQDEFLEGWKIFTAFLLFFFPALLAISLSSLSFFVLLKNGESGYWGHLLLFFFFLFLGFLASFLGFLAAPVFFFRFLESNEFHWAINFKGILEDLNQMGSFYWENWLSALALFGIGLFIATIFCAFFFLLFGGVVGGIFGILLYIFFSSFWGVYLLLLSIRKIAPLFAELHYRYS
jgi:hypothetical protein